MKLIIVRHAAAVESSPETCDEKRYLTPEGRVLFRKTSRTMLKNGVEPAVILTSPLLRAVQTADILAESLSFSGPLVVRNELKPGFDKKKLERLLGEYQSAVELVLVGHEPDLSAIIASLLSLPGGFNFKKGTAVKLKVNPTDLSAPAPFKWMAAGKKLITARDEAFIS